MHTGKLRESSVIYIKLLGGASSGKSASAVALGSWSRTPVPLGRAAPALGEGRGDFPVLGAAVGTRGTDERPGRCLALPQPPEVKGA